VGCIVKHAESLVYTFINNNFNRFLYEKNLIPDQRIARAEYFVALADPFSNHFQKFAQDGLRVKANNANSTKNAGPKRRRHQFGRQIIISDARDKTAEKIKQFSEKEDCRSHRLNNSGKATKEKGEIKIKIKGGCSQSRVYASVHKHILRINPQPSEHNRQAFPHQLYG
jgi:hypothetical protein